MKFVVIFPVLFARNNPLILNSQTNIPAKKGNLPASQNFELGAISLFSESSLKRHCVNFKPFPFCGRLIQMKFIYLWLL